MKCMSERHISTLKTAASFLVGVGVVVIGNILDLDLYIEVLIILAIVAIFATIQIGMGRNNKRDS